MKLALSFLLLVVSSNAYPLINEVNKVQPVKPNVLPVIVGTSQVDSKSGDKVTIHLDQRSEIGQPIGDKVVLQPQISQNKLSSVEQVQPSVVASTQVNQNQPIVGVSNPIVPVVGSNVVKTVEKVPSNSQHVPVVQENGVEQVPQVSVVPDVISSSINKVAQQPVVAVVNPLSAVQEVVSQQGSPIFSQPAGVPLESSQSGAVVSVPSQDAVPNAKPVLETRSTLVNSVPKVSVSQVSSESVPIIAPVVKPKKPVIQKTQDGIQVGQPQVQASKLDSKNAVVPNFKPESVQPVVKKVPLQTKDKVSNVKVQSKNVSKQPISSGVDVVPVSRKQPVVSSVEPVVVSKPSEVSSLSIKSQSIGDGVVETQPKIQEQTVPASNVVSYSNVKINSSS